MRGCWQRQWGWGLTAAASLRDTVGPEHGRLAGRGGNAGNLAMAVWSVQGFLFLSGCRSCVRSVAPAPAPGTHQHQRCSGDLAAHSGWRHHDQQHADGMGDPSVGLGGLLPSSSIGFWSVPGHLVLRGTGLQHPPTAGCFTATGLGTPGPHAGTPPGLALSPRGRHPVPLPAWLSLT